MLAISSRVAAPAASGMSLSSSVSSAKGTKRGVKSKLGFYREHPVEKIELDVFEQYAIDRLQVLRRCDVLKTRGINGDEFKHEMLKTDAKYLPQTDLAKDHISHYVLRLAYCRTEDLRRWFLAQECALFSLRFGNAGPAEVDAFMDKAGLRYVPISAEEKARLEKPLLDVYKGSVYGKVNTSIKVAFAKQDFYKVPFTDVLPLVSKRTVYLEKGYAYVPRSQLATIVQGAFRAHLSRELTVAYKSMALIQGDERIAPLVRNLGRIAYRLGRANTAADADTVLQTFMSHLVELGHSQPKSKPAGQDRFYIAVGYRKANERDKTCPIAGRCHKSNTQKYTVFVDTQVMQQGCWDSACQETGKHIYYQIQGNKVVNCGWNPPPPPQVADTSGKKLKGNDAGSSSSSSSNGVVVSSALTGFNKK